MSFHKFGGLSALICAATYLFGFAFLLTFLAPTGYGTTAIDAGAVVSFIAAWPAGLILFNSVIYILNALALVALVVALAARLSPSAPGWAAVTRGLGLIWAALVLGAGMIGNVAAEQAARLAAGATEAAADLWLTLHAVELGLGGGNEIAGGVWIAAVSFAALQVGVFGRITAGIGLLAGAGGLLTLIPALGDVAGAIFGLGAIAWFIAAGVTLLRRPAEPAANLVGVGA